jgi:hypothetical protein
MSKSSANRLVQSKWVLIFGGLTWCILFSGCRVGLLLGLLIAGPPTVEPEFDRQTKESMTDKDVTVAVVCFAPTEVRTRFRSFRQTIFTPGWKRTKIGINLRKSEPPSSRPT